MDTYLLRKAEYLVNSLRGFVLPEERHVPAVDTKWWTWDVYQVDLKTMSESNKIEHVKVLVYLKLLHILGFRNIEPLQVRIIKTDKKLSDEEHYFFGEYHVNQRLIVIYTYYLEGFIHEYFHHIYHIKS